MKTFRLIIAIILMLSMVITEFGSMDQGRASQVSNTGVLNTNTDLNLPIEFPATTSFQDYPVTSPNDPLFIEMDDEVYNYIPATIKLHINDEYIKNTANFIEVSCNQDIYDTNGNIYVTQNRYYPYDGEDVVEFGIRPVGVVGQDSGINFNFIYTTTTQEEYPDKSPGSGLEGFECNRKTWPPDSDTFCNGETCTMCYRFLGGVQKDFMLLPSSSSSILPGGYDFVDTKEVDSYYEGKEDYPGFLEYGYVDDSDYTCITRYSFRLDASYAGSIVERLKSSSMFSSYSDTSAPGGNTQGDAIELLTDSSKRVNDERYYIDVDYKLIADFDPPGSGGIEVEVHRHGCGSGSVTDEVVAAAKAFAAGYTLTPGKFEDYTPKHNAWLPSAPIKQPDATPLLGATFTGRITDSQGHPLAYSEMQLHYSGKWHKGFASEKDGSYSINILDFNPDEESRVSVASLLNYNRDRKNYFDIRDEMYNDKRIPYLMKSFDYEGPENLVNDIGWAEPKGEGWYYISSRDSERAQKNRIEWQSNIDFYATKTMSLIYYHFHNTVDFYTDILGVELDYKLPVEVFVRGNKWSQYSPKESQILIYKKHTSIEHPKRGFVEMHEFSHHVMYDLYGKWPEGDYLPDMKNHAGYINPSTADSFIEGFAEFIPMVINDYTGVENPHIYSDFGSLELNYKTSSRRGRLEEFAIAGVLWDLYDSNNDWGDTISMDLPDIWSIISVKRQDFYEYYKAFVDAFPEKKAQIDAVFIAHGFFADTNKGNGQWDYAEPLKDANRNGRHDQGEIFVDYGSASGLPAAMFYDTGETIGKATDYDRPDRSLEAYYPNAYLKVPDTEALLYTVSVDLADPMDGQDYEYTTGQADGLIYLMPLPDHIDATITVRPGQGFSAKEVYTITNDEYSEKLYTSEGEGYFDEHEFEINGTGIDILFEGEEWGFDFDGGYDSDEVVEVDEYSLDLPDPDEKGREFGGEIGDDSGGSSGSSVWIIIVVVFVAIVFAVIGFFAVRYIKKLAKVESSTEPTKKAVAKPVKKAAPKADAKFCRKCGQELSSEVAFCRHCGSRQS